MKDYESFGPMYFPHKFPDIWEKIKEMFTSKIETISDLNKIFFQDNSRFLKELEKNYPEDGKEFINIFQNISSLVLDSEKIFPKGEIDSLKMNTTDKIILTRKQVALIFILGFFDIFNLDPKKTNVYQRYDFHSILNANNGSNFSKGRCFFNYLTVIGKWLGENNKLLEENVTYIRENKEFNIKDFSHLEKLCDIEIIEKGSLFDSDASFCVDFANKYIGGGVLSGGCVQEEILFVVEPEAIVSIFFMEKMEDNDAIRIDNLIQFSNYSGYGRSFKYEESAIKKGEIKKHNIIAIDAVCDYSKGGIDKESVERDLIKAYIGFNLINLEEENVLKLKKTIATGNWGCGAFGGDFELKFIQQWLAATFAGVEKLYYYTFERKEMNFVNENLKKMESYKAYDLYLAMITEVLFKGEVLKIIINRYENSNKNHPTGEMFELEEVKGNNKKKETCCDKLCDIY